jgi:hypothetical protein
MNDPSSTLVCAFSAFANVHRRNLCRKTWFPALRDLGYDPRFILSKPDPESWALCARDYDPYDCIILHGSPPGYRELPQKTAALCRWALTGRMTGIWKMDDDTAVMPARFDAFTRSLTAQDDYCGFDVGGWQNTHCGTSHGPYASGGAGYWLSAKAAAIVAEKLTDKIGAEDLLVGKLMADAGITLRHDRRFCPWPTIGVPAKGNDLITSHALDEGTWMKAWENR